MAILPGAESFSHAGSSVGVLMCHGFTGTPQGLRGWAQDLADQGYTVRLPRLPGHGTTWQELNRTRWQDWYATVDTTFRELHERCEQVVVAGLSMGAALSLQLAQDHGPRICGLVLVNPAIKFEDPRLVVLPVLKHLVGSLTTAPRCARGTPRSSRGATSSGTCRRSPSPFCCCARARTTSSLRRARRCCCHGSPART